MILAAFQQFVMEEPHKNDRLQTFSQPDRAALKRLPEAHDGSEPI